MSYSVFRQKERPGLYSVTRPIEEEKGVDLRRQLFRACLDTVTILIAPASLGGTHYVSHGLIVAKVFRRCQGAYVPHSGGMTTRGRARNRQAGRWFQPRSPGFCSEQLEFAETNRH